MPTAGVVSYLNARPLIDALAALSDWRLVPAVPSALLAMLDRREIDLALLPVVDYVRRRDMLRLVSDACIAADGPVLTVRVFSRVPPDRIRRLAIDTDSHTSVVLARLLWRRTHHIDLELVRDPAAEAVLMIGDKVIHSPPPDRPHQIDLADAWKRYSGLPMVFAAWFARGDALSNNPEPDLAATLSTARDQGVACAREIAFRSAGQYRWPAELAEQYLTTYLKFRLDDRARAGLDRFLRDADADGLLDRGAGS